MHNYRIGDIVFLKDTSLQVEETKLAYVVKRYYKPPYIDEKGESIVIGIKVITIDKEIIPFIPIEEYKNSLIFVTESFFIYGHRDNNSLENFHLDCFPWIIDNLGYDWKDYSNLKEIKIDHFHRDRTLGYWSMRTPPLKDI